MSDIKNIYELALVAIISEAKETSIDITKLISGAKAGILTNSYYSMVGTDEKLLILDLLNGALVHTEHSNHFI